MKRRCRGSASALLALLVLARGAGAVALAP